MDKLEEEVFAIERILSKQNDTFGSPYLFGDLGDLAPNLGVF
ncbi:hypothetical protein [Sphingobacterium prati]|nr:hypothetical protein [Sphingobacterium prati]